MIRLKRDSVPTEHAIRTDYFLYTDIAPTEHVILKFSNINPGKAAKRRPVNRTKIHPEEKSSVGAAC